MAVYNAFRLLISEQPSLFPPNRDKRVILTDILNNLIQLNREEFIVNGVKQMLYNISEPDSRIYIFQFAREERFNYNKEVDGRLQVQVQISNPYVNLIIDSERQVFLIENKPSVYQTIDVAVRRLEFYFQRQFNSRSDSEYKISLTAISREVDFWNEIEKAERIYSLEFIFNPPNLFEGRFEANELVDEAYKATDFSEFKIKFINEKGRLKVMEENLHNFVSLIASGAGRYIAKMVRFKGRRRETRKINSNYFGSQQTLPDNISEISVEDLIERLTG